MLRTQLPLLTALPISLYGALPHHRNAARTSTLTPIYASRRLMTNRVRPPVQHHVESCDIVTAKGQWIDADIHINFLEKDPKWLKYNIKRCRNELFNHFDKKPLSSISLTTIDDQNGTRITHEPDPELISDLRRHGFSDNPLLSVSVELPHSILSYDIEALDRKGAMVKAKVEMAYQLPPDPKEADLMKEKVNQLLEDYANSQEKQISCGTHTNISEEKRPPFIYIERADTCETLVLQRCIINSVTRSIQDRFIEEFNKKHPLSPSTEATIAVLGGIPIMVARLAVHNITIRALAKTSWSEPHISSSDYDQYQRTMRYSTLALGSLVALLGLCGVNDLAYMVWSYMDQTGHRKCISRLPYPMTLVCAFFGLPYALFIAGFVCNETNYVRHINNYICFGG